LCRLNDPGQNFVLIDREREREREKDIETHLLLRQVLISLSTAGPRPAAPPPTLMRGMMSSRGSSPRTALLAMSIADERMAIDMSMRGKREARHYTLK